MLPSVFFLSRFLLGSFRSTSLEWAVHHSGVDFLWSSRQPSLVFGFPPGSSRRGTVRVPAVSRTAAFFPLGHLLSGLDSGSAGR